MSTSKSTICFLLVWLGCVWKKLDGDIWGEDALNTSYACSAIRLSWMDPVHPLYEGGPTFLEPEQQYSPASVPTEGEIKQIQFERLYWSLKWLFYCPKRVHTSPKVGSWSPSPTMRMQSAWRMQRWVHGVILLSVWYRTIRFMSSCWASQPERRYSWILMSTGKHNQAQNSWGFDTK